MLTGRRQLFPYLSGERVNSLFLVALRCRNGTGKVSIASCRTTVLRSSLACHAYTSITANIYRPSMNSRCTANRLDSSYHPPVASLLVP